MQTRTDHRYRAALLIVRRVDDELVVERELEEQHRQFVIGLDDLFGTGMRQHAVADQNAEPALVEKLLVDFGDTVDDAGQSECVVGSAPLFAGELQAGSSGAVDIGEGIRLDVTIGEACARKHAELFDNLLFEVQADATTALILTHRCDIGRTTCDGGKSNCVGEAARARTGQKSGDRKLAGLLPHLVSTLDLGDPLELRESRIEVRTVGHDRLIEYAATNSPVALIPLGGGTIGETPGVCGIVEGPGVDDRPVHEVAARIVRVFIGVKNVGHAEFADREHQPVCGLRIAELVRSGLYFRGIATEIYAFGASSFTATPGLNGSLNFSNPYNISTGNGSYSFGLQAGYDHMTASRWLIGLESDVSFPSFLGGNRTTSSAQIGTANYLDRVEFSGTVRGRLGYAPNLGNAGDWLFYATGGFAWSYDQFTRLQIVGVPISGTAVPGMAENSFLRTRTGGAAGGGIEVALPVHWTAQLKYLFIDYGSRSIIFPAGAQVFNSNLMLNEVRFGLNYRFNGNQPQTTDTSVKSPALVTDNFAVYAQTTFLQQYAPPFHAPYAGTNSLVSNQGRETWDGTAYLGMRLWSSAELWVNPEIDQGFGLSGTEGVAGFPGGESDRIGASVPYARVPRAFVRQTIIDIAAEIVARPIIGGLYNRRRRLGRQRRRQVRGLRTARTHQRHQQYASNKQSLHEAPEPSTKQCGAQT